MKSRSVLKVPGIRVAAVLGIGAVLMLTACPDNDGDDDWADLPDDTGGGDKDGGTGGNDNSAGEGCTSGCSDLDGGGQFDGGVPSDGATGDGATAEGDGSVPCTSNCSEPDAGGPPDIDLPFESNHIVATVDNVVRTTMSVKRSADPLDKQRLILEGISADAYQGWKLHVPEKSGTYECDDEPGGTEVQLTEGFYLDTIGSSLDEGRCTITVVATKDGVYYGSFAGYLPRDITIGVYAVTQGTFYYGK